MDHLVSLSVLYEVELLNFVEHGGVDDIELLSEVIIFRLISLLTKILKYM